jgi:hypothetical protein
MNQPAGPSERTMNTPDYGRCQIAECKEVVNAKQEFRLAIMLFSHYSLALAYDFRPAPARPVVSRPHAAQRRTAHFRRLRGPRRLHDTNDRFGALRERSVSDRSWRAVGDLCVAQEAAPVSQK